MKRGAAQLALCILLAACATRRPPPATASSTPSSCDAAVSVAIETPLVLAVDVRCHGGALTGFVASEPASLPHIRDVTDGAGQALKRQGSGFSFGAPEADAQIKYRVDLDAIAASAESFDVALRSGASVVSPVSTWLVHPAPLSTDVPVRIRVTVPPGFGFATSLTRAGDAYTLEAHEIPVASYAVFGRFESQEVRVDGSRLRVVFADGKLDASRADVTAWVAASARAVADFWHKFPVPRVQVTLIPLPGREGVVFGKVLPESAPGVVLLVGEHTRPARLYQDWILIHELFHLGVPSFSGEGRWFDEGLATYYEPIIRARVGWRTEASVWEEFRRAMPQGLAAVGKKGLEDAADFAEVYWGGAIVVMLADIEIRTKTAGARGLEDGLRGVLDAGGHASEVWPLSRTFALSDETCGVAALEPLARAHAHSGRRVDLEALWRQLGVEGRGSALRLNADAPLARVRRSIVLGPDANPQNAAARN